MKKITCTLLALLLSINLFAQFKLTGTIVNYTGKEKLTINIPLVYGFQRENSIEIPVKKNGDFEILLSINQRKFANLIYQRHFNTLLLNPTKNLRININEKDSTVKIIGGTAIAENKMMQVINLEEYPFFLEEGNVKQYTKLGLASLTQQVVAPYYKQRDLKIAKVEQSSLTKGDKLAIQTEIKSIAYNYLNDFARTSLTDRKIVDSLIIYVFDVSDKNPLVYPAGPQFFAFIRNYMGYLETKAFFKVKPEQLLPNDLIPYFGLNIDSATKIVKLYGKPYWRWIGATKNLPLKVVEPYAYQEIINLYNAKDLKQMQALANVFEHTFTKSVYKPNIVGKLNNLRKLLLTNETNANIKIFDGYEKVSSIDEVIKTLKGKVVYVDVWGTWCGPCKEELTYNPQLKAKFANKDVAFVYLDMDDDDRDATWKEFIKVNGLTGIHLRKNRKTIAPFWVELLAKTQDKEEYYPQYFIFDKEGKLVVSKANRPSDGQKLYSEIEKFLN